MPLLTKRTAFIATVTALGMLYLLTRLSYLTNLPIFTDEAIYIRWSQIGGRDANWRFISLTDGKQPMFTWLAMVVMRFIGDPLLAGRLVSVGAGAGSIVGLGFLAYELFRSIPVGLLASFLYIVSPFSLMYDRMALYDSLVAMFFIWNLYLTSLLSRYVRLDVALLLGMMLGVGMLNKTSGFLSLYLLPVSLLLFRWSGSDRKQRFFRWVFLAVVAALVSQAAYSVLRLSPFFHIISQKDSVFIYPLGEWFGHTTRFLVGNLRGMFDWTWHYMTAPIFFAAILSVFRLFSRGREKMLLVAWWFLPFLALALFARILYPRFVLFMTMPLVLLAAMTLWEVCWACKQVWVRWLLVGMLVFPSVWSDYFIITNPLNAPIPQADKNQYIDDWPSGWGIREVNAFFTEESKKGKIVVLTEGTFGLLPYAIEISQVDNPNVSVRGIWPLPETVPEEIAVVAKSVPTYLVLNQSLTPPPGWPLTLLAQYPKGNHKTSKLQLYKLISPIAKKV